MKRFYYILPVILTLFFSTGCSIRKMAVNEIAGMAHTGLAAFEQDEDLGFVISALPANIKLFEVLLKNDPNNQDLLTLLSRMYASYGFMFCETQIEGLLLGVDNIESPVDYFGHADIRYTKTALETYYLKGAEYGLSALETRHKNSRGLLENVSTLDDFFQLLTKEDVPALFWYGFNLGGYVNLNRDSVTALSRIHVVEKAMLRVVELDPDYFYAGGHLYLTSFYASRSPMMGGKPEAAKAHYDALKEKTGQGFLLADVFYARYYLYQMQERDQFEKVLKEALASPVQKKYALYNQVAIDRAKIYLKAIDDLFP